MEPVLITQKEELSNTLQYALDCVQNLPPQVDEDIRKNVFERIQEAFWWTQILTKDYQPPLLNQSNPDSQESSETEGYDLSHTDSTE